MPWHPGLKEVNRVDLRKEGGQRTRWCRHCRLLNSAAGVWGSSHSGLLLALWGRWAGRPGSEGMDYICSSVVEGRCGLSRGAMHCRGQNRVGTGDQGTPPTAGTLSHKRPACLTGWHILAFSLHWEAFIKLISWEARIFSWTKRLFTLNEKKGNYVLLFCLDFLLGLSLTWI